MNKKKKTPKSYWNFRVASKTYKPKIGNEYKLFGIVECYYGKGGKIEGCKDFNNLLIWDNYDDLKYTYDKIKKAFDKPILDLDNEESFLNKKV